MTNQVNQAFEKWYQSKIDDANVNNDMDMRHELHRNKSRYEYGYQAATKASEQRINELLTFIGDISPVVIATWKLQGRTVKSELEDRRVNIERQDALIQELQAHVNQLREALEELLPAYRKAVKLYDSNHDDAYTVKAHNVLAKTRSIK